MEGHGICPYVIIHRSGSNTDVVYVVVLEWCEVLLQSAGLPPTIMRGAWVGGTVAWWVTFVFGVWPRAQNFRSEYPYPRTPLFKCMIAGALGWARSSQACFAQLSVLHSWLTCIRTTSADSLSYMERQDNLQNFGSQEVRTEGTHTRVGKNTRHQRWLVLVFISRKSWKYVSS